MNSKVKTVYKQIEVDKNRQEDGHTGILLIEFTQLQELKVKVAISDDEVQRLDGPLDEVRWADTKLASSAVINALIRTGFADATELVTSASFVRAPEGSSWNASMALRMQRDDVNESSLQYANEIILETLQSMFRDPRQKSNELFERMLPDIQRQAVEDVVQETLSKIGGRTIRYPVQVSGPQLEPRILDSKLAPKPSMANFEPKPVDLKGKVRGFIHDHAKCLIYFEEEERSQIEIAFDHRMVGQTLDLKDVTKWNLFGTVCDVRSHQTLSTYGTEQFTLVRINPCSQAGV